ncbi:MAG: hypothetical protein C7B47_12070 [Sulfobacillus thermosulfidooxidans]|uniref:histidine kinase n=1 Tax=Sulfobacillus thermosulfidooxidans TaxID=28034 RepID=A0A2T2WTA4_SULTH|nr:MAG: hypothetical protein C7B47_12070 [Sulfobacillus thermosulfidooxidans]
MMSTSKIPFAHDNFLASLLIAVGHDVKNYLNAILGYSELLAEDAVDNEDIARAADLGKIYQSAQSVLGMVGQLIDLAKVVEGTWEFQCMEINVTEFLLSRDGVGEKIQLDEKPSSSLVVRTDPLWLEMAWKTGLDIMNRGCPHELPRVRIVNEKDGVRIRMERAMQYPLKLNAPELLTVSLERAAFHVLAGDLWCGTEDGGGLRVVFMIHLPHQNVQEKDYA